MEDEDGIKDSREPFSLSSFIALVDVWSCFYQGGRYFWKSRFRGWDSELGRSPKVACPTNSKDLILDFFVEILHNFIFYKPSYVLKVQKPKKKSSKKQSDFGPQTNQPTDRPRRTRLKMPIRNAEKLISGLVINIIFYSIREFPI